MIQTNTADLDPSLRRKEAPKTPEAIAANLALIKANDPYDRLPGGPTTPLEEDTAGEYAGPGVRETNYRDIDHALKSGARQQLYEVTNGNRRDVLTSEVYDTTQANTLAAEQHGINASYIQSEATSRVGEFVDNTRGVKPTVESVESRMFGEQVTEQLTGENWHEEVGLNTHELNKVTRAAAAGEFVDQIVKQQNVEALEKMPPQTGIRVAGYIQRLSERYGSSDKMPTAELAQLGKLIENIQAVEATGGAESFVLYDKESGAPKEVHLDDAVVEAMEGDFSTLEQAGVPVSNEQKSALAFESISEDEQVSGTPEAIALRQQVAQRLREQLRATIVENLH